MTIQDTKRQRQLLEEEISTIGNGTRSKVETYRWSDPLKPGQFAWISKTRLRKELVSTLRYNQDTKHRPLELGGDLHDAILAVRIALVSVVDHDRRATPFAGRIEARGRG